MSNKPATKPADLTQEEKNRLKAGTHIKLFPEQQHFLDWATIDAGWSLGCEIELTASRPLLQSDEITMEKGIIIFDGPAWLVLSLVINTEQNVPRFATTR